jgi:hypothetical protein
MREHPATGALFIDRSGQQSEMVLVAAAATRICPTLLALQPDKNGNIADCLVLSPTPPDSGFSCPKGQVMRGPFNVSYSDISLTDDTNNVSANGLPSFIACP